jgi:hypothetical protein
VTEREVARNAARRLAILQHAEEVIGNADRVVDRGGAAAMAERQPFTTRLALVLSTNSGVAPAGHAYVSKRPLAARYLHLS